MTTPASPPVAQAIAARNLFEPVWQSIVPKIAYICLLPGVFAGAAVYLGTTIIPMYEKIFAVLNTRLPDMTVSLFSMHRSGWFLWALLGAVWPLFAALFLYIVLRYAGAIRWDLPGMGWLFRRRHVAKVLDALALAAQRQRPWGAALSILASTYPQRSIERRLWAACDDLQAGGDDLQCLHARGLLGKTDLALLQSARQNGNLAWAAGEIADSNRRRFIYRAYALVQVVFPLVIAGYGLLVGAISIAMFLPLVDLIWRLAHP